MEFRTIDLALHSDLCVRFLREAYVCSFGNSERFENDCGADGSRYLEILADRIPDFPSGYLHLWSYGEIVGQIEMRPRDDADYIRGYIGLFYLVPELRGAGVGGRMHDYALSVFAGIGVNRLRLNVSPSNLRAVRFYERRGWVDLGPRPGYEHVHLMELLVP